VREILVLYSAEIRADLLCREPDGSWPDSPFPLRPGGIVKLASLGFAVPIEAFYR
jgi:hypothetical protein